MPAHGASTRGAQPYGDYHLRWAWVASMAPLSFFLGILQACGTVYLTGGLAGLLGGRRCGPDRGPAIRTSRQPTICRYSLVASRPVHHDGLSGTGQDFVVNPHASQYQGAYQTGHYGNDGNIQCK